MCGLSGSLNLGRTGYSIRDSKIQHTLLVYTTTRGTDGTGIVVGPMNKDSKTGVTYMKDNVVANEFLNKTELAIELDDARWILTHTRAATIGGTSKEACHPFSEEHVVGVHNGTVANIKTLFPGVKGINDSEIIYKMLSEKEPDEAVEVLKKIDCGAYALTWYDVRLEALRFARNKDRPLWFYKDRDTWWWASEPAMIAAAIAKESYDPMEYRNIKPWQLKENTLLTIPVYGGEATVETYVPPFVAPAYHPYSGATRGHGYVSGYNDQYYGRDQDYPFGGSGYTYNDRMESYREPVGNAYLGRDYPRPPSKEGWISLNKSDDLWQAGRWTIPFRRKIAKHINDLVPLDRVPAMAYAPRLAWEKGLKQLSVNLGNMEADGNVLLVGQAVSTTTGSVVYGAKDLASGGTLPIVGMLTKHQKEVYEKGKASAKAGQHPVFQGKISGFKVYASGEIGILVDDLLFMGWVDPDSLSDTELAHGGCDTHPHLNSDNYEEAVDWSAWTTADSIPY